jgi:hypothetical protein
MPAQQLRFINKLGFDPNRFLNATLMTAAETGPDANWDANFKQMRTELMADATFLAKTSPQIKFFLNKSEDRWRVSWIGASQIVHGTLVDAVATIKPDMQEPVTFEVTGDSRLPKPNSSLLDLCQYPVFTILHLKELVGIQDPKDLNATSAQVAELIKRRDELDAD